MQCPRRFLGVSVVNNGTVGAAIVGRSVSVNLPLLAPVTTPTRPSKGREPELLLRLVERVRECSGLDMVANEI